MSGRIGEKGFVKETPGNGGTREVTKKGGLEILRKRKEKESPPPKWMGTLQRSETGGTGGDERNMIAGLGGGPILWEMRR